jgi:two-component system NtrC family sensor kinase
MNDLTEKNRPNYQAISRKIVVIMTVISILPVFIISLIFLTQFHDLYNKRVQSHLVELVLKHKDNIDNFLKEKLSNIQVLSHLLAFDDLDSEKVLEEKLALFRQYYGSVFVDLGVINDQGFQLAYAGPFKLLKADYSKAEWFKQAINSPYFISDVFLGLREQPHFIIAVRHSWKGRYYIIRATIDFQSFNSFVENIRIGKTGMAFIINTLGEFQTKPDVNIKTNQNIFLKFIKNSSKSKDHKYFFEKIKAAGQNRIYVASFLKNHDWMLVYQQDLNDAFYDFNRMRNIKLSLILIIILCAGGYSFFFSRRVVKRIRKSDRESEIMNQQVIETGKLATVGELAAGIAHEINNPVAIMVEEAGWMEDLLSEDELQQSENLDEFKRALKQINRQGKRCKEITHKLLSFARKTDSRIEEIQINDLLEEMVVLSSQRAKFSNIKIITSFESSLPNVLLSTSEMQQVFLNLINNSIDAMEGKEGGLLSITSRLDGDNIHIKIEDNGPGIPQANLSRVFDPFFTTKPVGKGTGLGLSICYGIIKKIGGEITVESVVDQGTVFNIKLPL